MSAASPSKKLPFSANNSAQAGEFERPRDRAREGRSELMERLNDFVLKHDVALTGTNLSTIVAALSGSDSGLARIFATREISCEPISQNWLDEVGKMHSREDERANALEGLLDRVENSLTKFAETAQSAQSETSEHRGAIDAQISELAKTADTAGSASGIDRLVDLSRVMLERIVQVEEAMKKSQAETAELRESLAEARAQADVDHLTRLPNRRAFERQLEQSATRAEEKGERLSLGFCDVDHFKSINDTHGHDAGDRVLVAIANTLKKHAGKHLFAARHGGEEFVVLFPGLTAQDAADRLDEIRIDLSSRQMVNRDNGKSFGRITFSAGVSAVQNLEDTREALTRADTALYQAKEAGRDRVLIG
ncbi:MAG: GGDEF domain-containing protein [Pseudomonadota bacterium]